MDKEEVEVEGIIIIEVKEESEAIEETEEEEGIEEIEEGEDREEVIETMNKVEEEIEMVMEKIKRNHMLIKTPVKLLLIKFKSSRKLLKKKKVF